MFSAPAIAPHFDRITKLLSIFWCPPKRTLTSKGSPHTPLRATCCHNELTFPPKLSKTRHHEALSYSAPAPHPWPASADRAPWERPLVSSPCGQPPLSFQSLLFPSRVSEALLVPGPAPALAGLPVSAGIARPIDPAARYHHEDAWRAPSLSLGIHLVLTGVLQVVMIVFSVQTGKPKYREACSRSQASGRWRRALNPGALAAELAFFTATC